MKFARVEGAVESVPIVLPWTLLPKVPAPWIQMPRPFPAIIFLAPDEVPPTVLPEAPLATPGLFHPPDESEAASTRLVLSHGKCGVD